MNDRKYKVWAEIDLSALRYNYRSIADKAHAQSENCRVISVVKSDAYGHGAELVCRTLLGEGCDFFAVAAVIEAEKLRPVLGEKPDLLILGYTLPDDAEILYRLNIIQTVFSTDYARALSDEMARLIREGILPADAALRVHVKLDTGMNRLGFDAADAAGTAAAIREIAAYPHLKIEGMFTHLCCADTDCGEIGMTARQLARFEAVQSLLEESGDCPPILHCCNSAGILHLPHKYKSCVRAGIILYGMSPSGEILRQFRPVMTLKTRIAHIHTLRAGESVSYGATFTAERDMRIATVPIGYGDGFVRRYKGASMRLADGTDAPIVGRICMDQCMIDIGDADVHPGDEVILFGTDDGTMLERIARAGETINYEISSILTQRVVRIPKP